MSLKELSKKTKISYSYLYKIENSEKANPTLDIIIRIATILNIDLTFIYINLNVSQNKGGEKNE